ncbi:DUF3037 domain-containing protein [Schinkia azotoformans]|uniref:DUF3037 domain-containing protein n=1 Tax=Schinkia azotoformans LMG 9581 TaxID=1131731 RepID=K6D4V8_SCHAZ|nr:DUF3037 domain-containing protein [Schinkia azotoformans]EKN67517.1 hypothetical protein BAZO_08506 [Schinkia azotoformans LMG 9581]MEC1637322.1 DUF3037 domain-containing protein [Schinkia azotoformans]MEC1943726.1 DUF3037 domain-containing protein [Schinkia azotoformans]
MNSKTIFYTICRYVPDIIRGEFINVGVLTFIPELGKSNFQKTRNLTRVINFDDELEMDVLKALLESLEIQFNNRFQPILGKPPTPDYLKNELVYFVNQIQFSEIRALNSSTVEEDIKDLHDMYLYYDQKKSNRINADRVKRLVSKLFTLNELKDVDRRPNEQNVFKQHPFDFSVSLKGETLLIKALSFDYTNYNRLYTEIKSFLFDLSYFKEMGYENIKVVINNTSIENDSEKLAYDLLSKEVDVYTVQQFAELLNGAEIQRTEQLSIF